MFTDFCVECYHIFFVQIFFTNDHLWPLYNTLKGKASSFSDSLISTNYDFSAFDFMFFHTIVKRQYPSHNLNAIADDSVQNMSFIFILKQAGVDQFSKP